MEKPNLLPVVGAAAAAFVGAFAIWWVMNGNGLVGAGALPHLLIRLRLVVVVVVPAVVPAVGAVASAVPRPTAPEVPVNRTCAAAAADLDW